MKLLAVIAGLLWPFAAFGGTWNALSTPEGLLRYVDATDGISRAEASDIAEAYFMRHVGCGSYSGISELPNAWVVEGQFGYSGEPIRDFLIDKQTGAIHSSIGPSYSDPKGMLDADTLPANPVSVPG